MSSTPIAIRRTGLVTPVGLSAPASCAAFRVKLTNPSQTRYIDSRGKWIQAHAVPLEQPWRGMDKLARMAAMAIDEALSELPRPQWQELPLLLCVAESHRPGRPAALDDGLFERIEQVLDTRFAPTSAVVPHGRVGVAVALAQARQMIEQGAARLVLVAAADSLLNWPALSHYERNDRVLTPGNSDGFMPGEAAGALLVGASENVPHELLCTGIGFGMEAAHVDSGEPLRAQGLAHAIRAALDDAGVQMQHMDYRIADLSGEQYYFKEAALALARTLHVVKQEFDLWHPAECMGETGAAAGVAMVATAWAAAHKQYACGPNAMLHMANDAGQRAAMCLQQRVVG